MGSGTEASTGGGVSVVVPVYGSEATLPALTDRLHDVLEPLTERFEIVLVNDGSSDRSWEVIEEIVARRPRVRGIDLMRNYGQHNALLCGIRATKYDTIVTLDDDLQHPPEEIPKLLGKCAEGYDVVYGTPDVEQHGLLRDVASRVTKLALQGAMGAETAGSVSAFRVLRRNVCAAFSQFRGPFVNIDVLLTWGTRRFAAVEVRHEPRRVGQSHYTVSTLMAHALNMITGFTTLPLQFATLMGFALTLFGLVAFLYVLVRFVVQGSVVPGFPFLASMIAIFSGAQMFALGIIGEYLMRMHFRTMDRPTYTVRRECDAEGGGG